MFGGGDDVPPPAQKSDPDEVRRQLEAFRLRTVAAAAAAGAVASSDARATSAAVAPPSASKPPNPGGVVVVSGGGGGSSSGSNSNSNSGNGWGGEPVNSAGPQPGRAASLPFGPRGTKATAGRSSVGSRVDRSEKTADAKRDVSAAEGRAAMLMRGASESFLGGGTMSARTPGVGDVSATTGADVLERSSVPYSDVFPIRDRHVGPQHFRMLKLLGRGGIGRVFLVQLKGTSKLYAMKVLTKDEMIQRNKVKRVMTEREILATANHPFVVTMYASFQTSRSLSFVMDYCSGGEFFKMLQKQPKRRLKEEAVKFYAAEVTLALEYLHHMGFIYRDLKPENILLRSNGHIALTDFDLSKQAHAVSPRVIQQQLSMSDKIKRSLSMKRNNSSLNNLEIVDSEPILPYQTNSFVGTEDYISPEIVNGVGQSSAVDWWTLGILIYEMLTGTTPFRANTSDETFNNIVTNQVKWPDDVSISPDCKQIVKKLLRREPEKRLGAENGATDIKRHKWFTGFNFALVRNATPPIIPKIRNPLDFTQYPNFVPEADHPAGDDAPGGVGGGFGGADSIHDGGDNENPANPFVNFNVRRDSHTLQY